MNEQKPGIEWTHPYGRMGWTWNPIKGCVHGCEWKMPDGAIAECYAKSIAEHMGSRAYPYGFAHLSFNEQELNAPKKVSTPSGIFVGSMADIVGAQVDAGWIQDVIDVMIATPQHIYFVLSKNPPRLSQFKWPENAWVGVSAPPSFMFGKELSPEQQIRWYERAFNVLAEIDVPVRWTSVEPLSFDVMPILEEHFNNFEWSVIGAASDGKKTHQPDRKLFDRAFKAMGGKPTFFKGNLSRQLANDVAGKWCEEFPMVTSDWRQQKRAS